MSTDSKTPGQRAYEAFSAKFLPQSIKATPWEDMCDDQRVAWEAAGTVRGTILGGPVEMRDYDHITLAQDHFYASSETAAGMTIVPAGTRLHMVKPEPGALGISYETGAACRAGEWLSKGAMKTTITTTITNEDEGRARIRVEVDGVHVGGGSIGGEPEDNSIDRDYSWIEETIEALARKLGSQVEMVAGQKDADDFD
jgi:hypothetical protein